MADRVTERTDGETTERVTETGSGPVVVERRGGGGGLLIGIAVLILVLIGAFYFLSERNRNERVKTDAISEAAKSIGGAADQVGGAAQKAGDRLTQNQQ